MAMDASILSSLEPIRGLSPQRLDELAGMCHLETFPIGTDVMPLGRNAGQFIYLVDGELRVRLHDGSSRLMVGGCDAANWPIGYKTVLPLSSKAITEVSLVCINFDLLDIMMTWDEVAGAIAPSAIPEKKEATAWQATTGAFSIQALTSSSLSQFPVAHIHELLQRFERVLVKRGQSIVREGDEGDYFYLIESGRCVVKKRVGGADVELAELKSGDSFGEESLLSGGTRNATVDMKTDGILLRLAKDDFNQLMRFPLLHSVTRAEAEREVASGKALWLDVRYAAEYFVDGLPGALNIPLNEIRSAVDLLDKSSEYIVYCQTGRRSSAAAFLLAQRGVTAYLLEGGLAENG